MGRRGASARADSARQPDLEFFARCAGGFEEVLGRELRGMRMRRVRPQVGGVIFFGTLRDGYRACLWSRVATRVQLVIGRVACEDADVLYQGIRDIVWEDLLCRDATVAVDAHGENPNLRNTKFVALKVKDALCDRMREALGARPDVDPSHPDFAVNVAVHPKKATVYLNLSGESLHRRGYRQDGVQTEAPLKETLAAGMLLAAHWDELTAQEAFFVDPMCGSGTLAIEAAMMTAHVAPGLLRQRWGFEGWQGHDQTLWEQVVAEAETSRLFEGGAPRIMAGDIDPRAVEIARANVERAGIADLVRLNVGDAADLERRLRGVRRQADVPGLLAVNPPYGERLLTRNDLPRVYAALAAAIDAVPKSWQAVLISPDLGIDTALGRLPHETIACHNGPIQTWVRRYDLSEPRQQVDIVSLSGQPHGVAIAEPNSAQFAGRLRKSAKELLRWARREGVACLRVYDADLPDYALSVDLYQGSGASEGERYAVVEERRRPAKVDVQRASRRFADAVVLCAAVLEVPQDHVLARPWQQNDRRQGRSEHVALVVRECENTFALDLNGRPDTGLPLQLRGVRKLVGSLAKGMRVANLLATTGAATIYAARAGAVSTVTVDPFADRIDVVRADLKANGLMGAQHRFACEDIRTWLEREAKARHTYDLVVLAPPAWMAGRDAREGNWELQRDHARLLAMIAHVLAPTGMVVFATQMRGFTLDAEGLAKAVLVAQDVSERVISRDFERSSRDLSCHLLRKS